MLKREILNEQILKGNNITILTDTRLNTKDLRDLEEQLANTHEVYSTESKYKRAGITIIVEKKINFQVEYKSNLTTNEGPKVLVISGTLPNKKRITIAGIYTAPENWKKPFSSLDSYLTSTYPKIKPGYISDPIFNEKIED